MAFDAIGGGVGNWIAGSNILGTDRQYGGFLIASFASQFSAGGALVVSAFDILTSTYGATMASQLLIGGSGGSSPQTGMKPMIVNFMDWSGDGTSAITFYHLSATGALAADDSVLVVIANKVSATVASGVTLLSNQSVHFMMQGFLVSVPFAYH